MTRRNMESGPMQDDNGKETKSAGTESIDIQNDIIERAKGNPESVDVLDQLASRGAEIYNTIAPKLGVGTEIWLKYRDECGKNLDVMIKKYGGEAEMGKE